MIENVLNGEKITAKTTNDIINACNGLMMPAEDNFTTTTKGPLFSKGAAPTSSRPTLVPDEIFQVYNGKSFEIQSRSVPYSYNIDSPQLTWFVNLPLSTSQLQTALRDISHKPILSVGVIAENMSSLDILLDNEQLSSTKNGWFDTASYDRQPINIAWLYDKDEEKWHAAITDIGSKDDIGDRASLLFGGTLSCIDICTIASVSGNKQYFMPPNGLCMTSADSEFDSLNDGSSDADEKHLSSLQHKVYTGKDSNGNEQIVDAWNLYNFDDLENTIEAPDPDNEEEMEKYDLVVRYRDDEDSGEVKYMALSSLPSSASVDVDTDATQSLKSIEWGEDNGEEYLQLYGMDAAGEELPQKAINMSADGYTPLLPNDYEFVLRKHGVGGEISYANLSCCIPDLSVLSGTVISGDTEVILSSKSIQTKEDQNGKKYHQLYNFDGCDGCWGDFTVGFDDNGCVSPIGCGATFVVKQSDGHGGHYIEYVPLSLAQAHEHLDSQSLGLGKSLSYIVADEGYGCTSFIELYNFTEAVSEDIDPDDLFAPTGDAILVRVGDGVRNELKYMTFESLSSFTPVEKGDSNFNGNEDKSVHTYWWDDNEYAIELYNWRTAGAAQTVNIYTDGCTYRWPQNTKINTQATGADYILIKHQDQDGNMTLQYKQLQVTMPDLSGYDQDITNIYNELNDYSEYITVLSGAIDYLSSEISDFTGSFWESGGDSGTCYGSDIGNSLGASVIDLDDLELNGGFWATQNGFGVGDSLDVTNDASIHGCAEIDLGLTVGDGITCTNNVDIGGSLEVTTQIHAGCAYFDGPLAVTGSGAVLQIGNTTLNEAQLSSLLQLII